MEIWSVRIPVYSLESNLINLITLVIYVKFLNRDLAINPFRTAKAVTNGNHTLSKMEITSKVSLRLTSRINLGRRGARAELSTLAQPKTPPPTHPHTHTHTHTTRRAQKGPYHSPRKSHPTGTTDSPHRNYQAATNENHKKSASSLK